MAAELRVAVVDDHSTVSELMARALDDEPGIACVGTATSAAAALELVNRLRPDVVLMDVQLGSDDGLETTARLLAQHPELRVVILTARTDADLVTRAAHAGACSLLPKNGSLSDVLAALRTAPRDGLTVHPHLLRELVTATTQEGPVPRLTDREREVLQLLAGGRTVHQIARLLALSEHTVRGHVKKLLQKLDAHSQLEAVAVATSRGLL
jgi:DNA-binding NarL/FixJ family response regulator